MNRQERRAIKSDPNVKPMAADVLAEARVVLARVREKIAAVGDADMAVARLEAHRQQAREAVVREERELNEILQREGKRAGIADGPDKWTPDLDAGVFRRAT